MIGSFRPQAVIFDIDGTIVDNMAIHAEAFGVFAERHGLPPLTNEDRAKLDGRRNSEIFPVLFNREMSRDEWRAFEDEKEGFYRELSKGRLAPLRGLIGLLDRLEQERVRVALATSAPRLNVIHTLAELELAHRFPVIVRGDEVAAGKPAPDVFIEAARRLEQTADACLVFEDAPMGVVAAQAAGMPVVALTTSFSAQHFRGLTPPPDLICADFASFTPQS